MKLRFSEQAKATGAEARIVTLETEVAAAQDDAADARENATAAGNRIATLEAKATEAEANATAAEARVVTLESEVSAAAAWRDLREGGQSGAFSLLQDLAAFRPAASSDGWLGDLFLTS